MQRQAALVVAAATALAAGWWQVRAPGGDPPLAWAPAPPAAASPARDAAVPAAAPALISRLYMYPAAAADLRPVERDELHSVAVAWFHNPREGTLEPVALRLPRAVPPAELALAAFQALCAGPPEEARRIGGLTTALGACSPTEAWLDHTTLHIRFDPAAVPTGTGVAADQLEMTASQFKGVRSLQLWRGKSRLGRPLPVDGRPAKQRQ